MTDMLLDLTGISANFPSSPEPEILREAHLRAVEERLRADQVDAVIVSGEEGAGKTTLLAQLARQSPSRTISVFVRGSSPTAHDPGLVARDIANQLHWAVDRSELPDKERVSPGLINNLLFDLNRSSHRSEISFRFVIDGLHEVQDEAVLDQLIDLIPIGAYTFSTVISDRDGRVTPRLRPEVKWKSVELYTFSRPDVARLLESQSLSDQELDEVWRITAGNPGRVGQFASLLAAEGDAGEVLDHIHRSGGLFASEWERIGREDKLLDLYGVIAFDHRENTLTMLARVVGMDLEAVRAEVLRSSLLTVEDGAVAYRTEAFVDRVKSKLKERTQSIREKIIADLVEGDPAAARLNLPEIYFEAERYQDVLDALAPESFREIATSTTSIGILQRFVEYGRVAAERMEREADHLRFSLDGSVLREVRKLRVWSSEVEAYLAHGDYNRALTLAQSAVLDEERLYLLARLTAQMIRDGEVVEPEVETQVRSLYKRLDFPLTGFPSMEIARELVHLCPDLAIDLVEQANTVDKGENALDSAFAVLAVTAAADEQRESPEKRQMFEERIQDPELREMTTGFSSLLAYRTAEEVIDQIDSVGSVSGRLFLVRHWIRDNLTAPDVISVVRYGLQLAIQSPDYSPNARVARDLARPLPRTTDASVLKEILHLLDVQSPGLKKLGPSADYIALRLLMAEAAVEINKENAKDRIVDVYLEVTSYPDPVTKAQGLSRVLATILKLGGRLEDPLELATKAREELDTLLDDLLARTAEQHALVRPILRALATVDLGGALELAQRLNTQPRRDRAVREVVATASRIQERKTDWGRLRGAIDQIQSPSERDKAIHQTIQGARNKDQQPDIPELVPILALAGSVEDSVIRCKLIVESLLECADQGYENASQKESWFDTLLETWSEIDSNWVKVDTAYGMARDLVEHFAAEARLYLSRAEEVRKGAVLDQQGSAASYTTAVSLALRCLEGLVNAGIDTEEEREHLRRLIDREDSIGQRLVLYNQLALVFFAADRRDEAHDITAERIRPLLDRVPEGDRRFAKDVLAEVAVSLYIDHASSAIEIVEELDDATCDRAISNILHFKLTKRSNRDAYKGDEGRPEELEVTDLQDACALLKSFRSDTAFFHGIRRITRTLGSKAGRRHFNDRIQLELADRLLGIVEECLPKDDYIPHPGYAIVSEACVLGIRYEAKDRSREDWRRLIEAIDSIPNEADRVFVSALVLEEAPHSIRRPETDWPTDVEEAAAQLPFPEDRQTRLQAVAKAVEKFDRISAKRVYRKALFDLEAAEDDENQGNVWPRYRRILDAAYDFDPDFAASLASLSEEEESRGLQRYGERVKALTERRQLKQALSDPTVAKGRTAERYSRTLSEAAWDALASLNAGRAPVLDLDIILPWLKPVAALPLREAYPAFALIIRHLSEKLAAQPQGANRLRALFNKAVDSADVAHYLFAVAKDEADAIVEARNQGRIERVNILAGRLDEAMEFLGDWFTVTARHYVKIVDPYFGPDELLIFRAMLSLGSDLSIQILARESQQKKVVEGESIPDAYRACWKQLFDIEPPSIEVTLVEAVEGKNPVHERLILTDGAGLNLGTSLNSLGRTVDATISRLSRADASSLEAEYDRYFKKERRPTSNVQLRYTQFQL